MKHLPVLASLLLLAACSSAPSVSTSVEWMSEQTGTGDFGEPQTNVTLVDNDGNVLVDTECIGVVGPVDIEGEANVISAVRCWWAGGGNDYVAETDANGELVVKTRWVDEESGFGNWEIMPL